jgi:DNA primase
MSNAYKRKERHSELPAFPISDILVELGAESVPTGFGWVRMHCPFHEDRTSSAAVNHDKQGFVCHSCGRRGDGLKLLQSELGLSFIEALNRAKELTGVGTGQRKSKTRRASDLLKGA